MYSLLDQNNSKDDLFFHVTYPSDNGGSLKYAGGSIVENGEYNDPPPSRPPVQKDSISDWNSAKVQIKSPHIQKKNKKKKNKQFCENFIMLGVSFMLLVTFAVTPSDKL
jgi:hypothetical protein